MNNLYEALEVCLQDIEQGADLETVLFRYPDLADELRPILEASAGAKRMAVLAPSADVARRNRAKVLQHAAHMREGKAKSSQRLWFASLRRIAVTLAVVTMLFVSGTGLVGASSNTLPGDNLYPVKRTWEGLRLFFAFNTQLRDTIELEHENERLHELKQLLAGDRSEEVDFNGLITSQNGNEWMVAGVRVLITDQTEFRGQGIGVGSAVRVRGVTQGNDTVLAERIRLLSSEEELPEVEDEHESESGNENNSGPGSGDEELKVEETKSPELENDNSGSGSDSNTNENDNSNSNEDSHSNDNTDTSNEGSSSNDISGSEDNSGSNDNGGSEDNSGSNDNDNSGGSDGSSNDNGDDSGGGDNSGSGSSGSDDGGGGSGDGD